MTKPLFELGRTTATRGALATMASYGILAGQLLERHVTGDWGDLDKDDKRANDRAVKDGDRIVSAYGDGDSKLYVITEWDRSVTTILRPDEY
jgi:hypothetical protein